MFRNTLRSAMQGVVYVLYPNYNHPSSNNPRLGESKSEMPLPKSQGHAMQYTNTSHQYSQIRPFHCSLFQWVGRAPSIFMCMIMIGPPPFKCGCGCGFLAGSEQWMSDEDNTGIQVRNCMEMSTRMQGPAQVIVHCNCTTFFPRCTRCVSSS